MTYDEIRRRDIEVIAGYILEDPDDFINYLSGEDETASGGFSGLTHEEIKQLNEIYDPYDTKRNERVNELLERAAEDPTNTHLYACALRTWKNTPRPGKETP